MRVLTLFVMTTILGRSCVGQDMRYQEPYIRDEIVATPSSGDLKYAIRVIAKGAVYWVPLRDVTRTRFESFVVEVERRSHDAQYSHLVRTDLLIGQGITGDSPPYFLGATDKYSFWGANQQYLVVGHESATVRRIVCDKHFLLFGSWKALDSETIQRTTRDGIFLLSTKGPSEQINLGGAK